MHLEIPGCGHKPKLAFQSFALAHELKSLHAARAEQFDPDKGSHEQLLRQIW